MLQKSERLGNEAMQVEFAEDQRARPRVIHQAAQGDRDAPGSLDALLDLVAPFGVGIFQFQFEVGKNSEQRIVYFVRGTKRKLRQRSVFFILREFSLKLAFSLLSLPSSENRRKSSCNAASRSFSPLPYNRLQLFDFLAEAFALVMLRPAKPEKRRQRYHQKRKYVEGKQR